MLHVMKVALYALSVLGLAVSLDSTPARAEIRALLVGANLYQVKGIENLQGPANDLAEVEKLIRSQGATDVTVLKDDQVTRTKVETAFHALGLRSKPGDWVVLFYAGHGAQAEAAVKGVKKDDLDDFLVLPHISLEKPDPENYIMSADLRAWLLDYIPSNVTVLQMVDACHSGTLQRKIDPRAPHFTPRLAFHTRTGPDALKLTARPAPQFSSLPNSIRTSLGVADPEYLPNVVYISAAQDDQYAQEAPLPEARSPSHGVLTYNFLAAMTGVGADGHTLVADTNHDGVVSMGELAVYLDTQTRVMTDQDQEPSVHFASAFQDRPLFTRMQPPAADDKAAPKIAVYAADPRARAILDAASDWRVASAIQDADYVWDFPTGDVLSRTGDVVARRVHDLPALQGVVEKWTTVAAIRPFLSEATARVRIGPRRNGVRYEAGSRVELTVGSSGPGAASAEAVRPAYVTVFDLASDGRVQTLYPLAEDGDGLMPAGSALPVLDTQVVEPFGTDHVFALLTDERPDNFRNLLHSVDGSRGAGRLVSAIKRELAKPGARTGLSVGELFTGPDR